MTYNFEFTENPIHYKLLLNGAPVRVYSKSRNSKQEAESIASEVVNKFIFRHGLSRVFYNGNSSVLTMADNFFNKIK